MQISKIATFSATISIMVLMCTIILVIRSIVELTPIYSNYILIGSIVSYTLIKPYYKQRWKGKPMKTLADFKRKIQVGVQLNTWYHKQPVNRDIDGTIIYDTVFLGTAPVVKVQSTKFAIERIRNGEKVESWIDFPKASECVVYENSIEIFEYDSNDNKSLVLTYQFV